MKRLVVIIIIVLAIGIFSGVAPGRIFVVGVGGGVELQERTSIKIVSSSIKVIDSNHFETRILYEIE